MIKILILLSCLLAAAGSDKMSFDKTVHDFGKVSTKDGALSCSFVVTNTGEDTLNLLKVISSCGCTSVKWTRTDIAPGKSGTIEATYTNDEGPQSFDKTLTVYTNVEKRPVVLHIRGIVKKN